MKQIERINRAKIQLMMKQPFFSFLCFHLKFKENKELTKEHGIAVNDEGTIYFYPDYIESLSTEEIIGALCHEVLHLSLLHLIRRNNRDKRKWDIATDIVVNTVLLDNDIKLPSNSLQINNSFTYTDKLNTIEDCRGMMVEQIYAKLRYGDEKSDDKDTTEADSSGDGDLEVDLDIDGSGDGEVNDEVGDSESDSSGGDEVDEGDEESESENNKQDEEVERHDEHIEDATKSSAKKLQEESKWKDRTASALMQAKNKGCIPNGIDRLFTDLTQSKLSWRELLQNHVQKMIPVDYTWARPSKKSIACREYLPDIEREKLDIFIAIDVSGSISEKDIGEFVSEILEIYSSYESSINLRVLSHDVEVHSDVEIDDAFEISNIKLGGGGGTSHIPVMEYLNETDCSFCLFITDGYSDLDEIEWHKNKFDSLFLLSKDATDSQLDGQEIIRL